MNINELIEKHAKETAEGGGWIEPKDAFRAESNNRLTHEWLKESFRNGFVELLETVKSESVNPNRPAMTHYRSTIDKALEELRK